MTSRWLFVHSSFVNMSVSNSILYKMPNFFSCLDFWPIQTINIKPFLSVFFNLKNWRCSIRKIHDFFIVNFKIRAMNCVHIVFLLFILLHFFQLVEQIFKSSWHYSSIFQIFLSQIRNVFIINRSLNCMSFSTSCLPISKNSSIVSIKTRIDDW